MARWTAHSQRVSGEGGSQQHSLMAVEGQGGRLVVLSREAAPDGQPRVLGALVGSGRLLRGVWSEWVPGAQADGVAPQRVLGRAMLTLSATGNWVGSTAVTDPHGAHVEYAVRLTPDVDDETRTPAV